MSTSFSYVCRSGDVVAHALAQRAGHCFPISIWLESYPADIASFVLADFQSSIDKSHRFLSQKKKKKIERKKKRKKLVGFGARWCWLPNETLR